MLEPQLKNVTLSAIINYAPNEREYRQKLQPSEKRLSDMKEKKDYTLTRTFTSQKSELTNLFEKLLERHDEGYRHPQILHELSQNPIFERVLRNMSDSSNTTPHISNREFIKGKVFFFGVNENYQAKIQRLSEYLGKPESLRELKFEGDSKTFEELWKIGMSNLPQRDELREALSKASDSQPIDLQNFLPRKAQASSLDSEAQTETKKSQPSLSPRMSQDRSNQAEPPPSSQNSLPESAEGSVVNWAASGFRFDVNDYTQPAQAFSPPLDDPNKKEFTLSESRMKQLRVGKPLANSQGSAPASPPHGLEITELREQILKQVTNMMENLEASLKKYVDETQKAILERYRPKALPPLTTRKRSHTGSSMESKTTQTSDDGASDGRISRATFVTSPEPSPRTSHEFPAHSHDPRVSQELPKRSQSGRASVPGQTDMLPLKLGSQPPPDLTR